MLESMRGLAHSFIAKALMIFLVLTFAVWGIGDTLRNHGSSYVVKVGDEVVSPGQFQAQQRNMQRALEQMGVAQIDPKALQGEILRQLVQQKLIQQWQHDSGLEVSRETLSQHIAADPEFRGKDGKFDPKLFTLSLQQRNLNEGHYLDELAHEIGGKTMLAAIDSTDITAPDSLLALAAAAGTQTRDAVLITIPTAPVEIGKVTDDEAKDFYAQHKDAFMLPEHRTLEYVVLDGKSLAAKADAAVTDPSQAAEQREQALQDIAANIEDALAGGKSMGEAVASVGIAAQSNLLKDVTADQFADAKANLQTAVVKQGFAMGAGESSNLMTSPEGTYYMVSVKTITPAAPKPFSEVTAFVKEAVAKEHAHLATRARVDAVKKALADGDDWQKAATAGNGSGHVVTGIPRPETGPNGMVKPTSGSSVPALLQQAVFEHAVGEVAGPAMLANGDAVMALVTAIHANPTTNDKARAAAAADYKAQLGNAVMTGTLRALAKRYPVQVNEGLMQQLQGGANE